MWTDRLGLSSDGSSIITATQSSYAGYRIDDGSQMWTVAKLGTTLDLSWR